MNNNNGVALVQLSDEMLKCKLKVYSRITEVEDAMRELRIQMKEASDARNISYELQKKMGKQQDQLFGMLSDLRSQLDKSDASFAHHDENEMEKYDQIVEALNSLENIIKSVAKETDSNTKAIGAKKHREELEKARRQGIEEATKPAKERKEKIIQAVYISVAVGTVSLIGSGIIFMYDMYRKFNGEG